jgi:DNA-binding GntR family transcriptional regulator
MMAPMLCIVAGSCRTEAAPLAALAEQVYDLRIVHETARGPEIARIHQGVTSRIEATDQEHAKILRAVIQRKADAAVMLLKSHIEQSKLEVRKITLHALLEARQRGRQAPA